MVLGVWQLGLAMGFVLCFASLWVGLLWEWLWLFDFGGCVLGLGVWLDSLVFRLCVLWVLRLRWFVCDLWLFCGLRLVCVCGFGGCCGWLWWVTWWVFYLVICLVWVVAV